MSSFASFLELLGRGVREYGTGSRRTRLVGGAAGNLTLTGIAVGDRLWEVAVGPKIRGFGPILGTATPLTFTGVVAAWDRAIRLITFDPATGAWANRTADVMAVPPANNQIAYGGGAIPGTFHVFVDVDRFARLTPEFTITAANTINNTGGQATTGEVLDVEWLDLTA